MHITTSTHLVRYVHDERFTVELIAEPDDGSASVMVDHVEVVRLTRWGEESDDAWANRVNTTRDAVVSTCERIAKELPTIAGWAVLPRVEPSPPSRVFPFDPFVVGGGTVTIPPQERFIVTNEGHLPASLYGVNTHNVSSGKSFSAIGD